MNIRRPPPLRVGIVLSSGDIRALDAAATEADASRSAYCRRILRRHLRELAASKVEAAA